MTKKLVAFFIMCTFLLPTVTTAYSTGVLDTTFASGLIAGSGAMSVAVQADGKILVGGDFEQYNGVSRNRIARLNTDGTLDTTFNPGQGVNSEVRSIALQASGKIIIAGYFTVFDGDVAASRILRLNADGTLDSSFNAGAGPQSPVDMYNRYLYSALLQPDGKIVIAGSFNIYDSTPINNIARLNADGTLDPAFTIGSGPNGAVLSAVRQSDGKLIIGGMFTSYNGVSRNRIARLNTDGTLDTSFNPGQGVNGEVHVVSLQADGKPVLGGYFSSFNAVSKNNLVRLNTDGNVDTSFDIGTGTNSIVLGIAQNDKKILLAGRFTMYNGVSRAHILRLGDTVVTPPPPATTPTPTVQADMTSATDTGSSNTDNITADSTPDFVTTCISGSVVTLYVDGVAVVNTATCVNSTATITVPTPLSTSYHNVTYTQKINGIESGYAPALPIVISNDDSGPLINGVTVIGHNASTTPSYTFTSSEAGTINYVGSCSSNAVNATFGFNTIVFKPLLNGTYSNCAIRVTDAIGNQSNLLFIAPFTVTQGQQSNNQSNQNTNQNVSTAGCTPFTAFSPVTGAKCPTVSLPSNSFIDTNPVICPHFTRFIRLNSRTNETNEVKRWQAFLNEREGARLVVDGKFGRMSFNAVKNFQAKYFEDILQPWGITSPTGFIYKATRAKANKIFGCSEGVVVLDNGATIQ
ncbi:MAG: Ig-like domain-containing protein [Candidatus Paceibacterota bacterium]